ncbi:hypothetical protein CDD81_5518 [Ophiocordyceps australis]|uniref:AAA+ ATPase domain-containing protein n=1 Tax=Ophiocordyceps australis TaxID=1399860 RepID=A0A2C5Y7Z7_9HYPO|nr:hypothetical protein CDD81_5518 [Ophiocordyceps australis]
MDSHGPVASPERNENPCFQDAGEDATRHEAGKGQANSKSPDTVSSSKLDSSPAIVSADTSNTKPHKSTSAKKHQSSTSKAMSTSLRAKRHDSSCSDHSSTSDAETDSDSSDSDSDHSHRAARCRKKKRNKSTRSTRKQKQNAKAKTTTSRGKRTAKDKRRICDTQDSDSDSSSSSCSDEDTDARRSECRDDSKATVKSDIYEELDRLDMRLSQLQNQMSQNTYPGMANNMSYNTMPTTFGLPMGNNAAATATNGANVGQAAAVDAQQSRHSTQTLALRRAKPQRFRPMPRAMGIVDPLVDLGPAKYVGSQDKAPQKGKKGKKMDFKRVDWIWDSSLYSYKLQDTAEMTTNSGYDDYIFHVRRTFDCEGKYRATFVDIRNKLLRECLQDVIGNVRGANLVDETPKLDPNLLFLYLEDFRAHLKALKKAKPAGDDKKERKKNRIRLKSKRKQLKVLIQYLDSDYAKTKECLYPMLESGVITFDLLWALWKPNTLVFGNLYGSSDDHRVFRVDLAYHQNNILRGECYIIEGKYLEYDGKKFGFGSLAEEMGEFQGARKITSLACYPLKYHREEARIRQNLIDRGKKFVALSGVHYKCYSGIAYMRRKKGAVLKFNIQQSRVMVDPAIFRRINPNYAVSLVRPKDHDIVSDDGLSASDSDTYGCESMDGAASSRKTEFVSRIFKSDKGDVFMATLPKQDVARGGDQGTLQSLPTKSDSKAGKSSSGDSNEEGKTAETPNETAPDELPDFSDEEYLIASPVVYGFSFADKQWLELSVSAIREITWNDKAWDSLVLEPATKDLIQALVQSRKYHAAQTIDDVIQGKGKGLVTVLHGPPGTGKTLTAEGISELLKCPLYMVSAGELGTDSRYLESELQKILDICHAWGAILLLDEADVFLEKRNMQDIHRNALVSIFLRQLEYFQGILFLTTNRVETFDEAFQSRIHIALRYDSLDVKARKTIFNMFFDRIKTLGKLEMQTFSEGDLDELARHDLNGREIKNVVGSAQDLAVSKGETFCMRHIKQVLDVHAKFGRDLRGGPGYEDAMRSYF